MPEEGELEDEREPERDLRATPEPAPNARQLRDRVQIKRPIRLNDYVEGVDLFADKDQEPRSFQEAKESEEAEKWAKAMDEELSALQRNEVWELVRAPADRQPIDCKWIYKLKRDGEGNINRYRARLVVRGFSQVQGIDY